jgi:hypothetical protein
LQQYRRQIAFENYLSQRECKVSLVCNEVSTGASGALLVAFHPSSAIYLHGDCFLPPFRRESLELEKTLMHSARTFMFYCLAIIPLVASSRQAFAAYAEVGSCSVPNPPAHTYTSIQAAVTASPAATVIQICPGIYPEQVVITKKLTLEGVLSGGQDAAVIVPPLTGLIQNTVDLDVPGYEIAAQVLVQNTNTALVTISNLTVDGTGNLINGCAPDPEGILFQNSSGTVNHVAVRNEIAGGIPNPCQSGEGINVQTAAGKTSKVTIENVSVHNYNKNGITGNDPGTTLILTGDFVQGSGLVPCTESIQGAAQNGIQLAYGATGTLLNSVVVDNVFNYDPTVSGGACNYVSADVILYDTAENSGVKIQHNDLGNSQYPVVLFEGNDDPPNYGDGVSITGNSVFGTLTLDGIDVCTNGNTVTGNTIINSAESGIHLDASCGQFYGGPATGTGNTVTTNTFVESACAGILDDTGGTGGNSYGTDTYYTVPFPVTFSTGSCPFVPAPNVARNQAKTQTQTKGAHKFSLKR